MATTYLRPSVSNGPVNLIDRHQVDDDRCYSYDLALRAYYSARAAEYDSGLHHRREREGEVAELRDLIRNSLSGKRVLDVACGTGRWTRYIAQFAPMVVGLDASAEMLRIAQDGASIDGLRFALGDAYCLGEDLGFFDAAFVGFWISHVPRSRYRGFFAGLSSRLLPGGTAVVIDNTPSHTVESPVVARDAEGNTFQLRTLRDGSTHRILKNFPNESELAVATAPYAGSHRFLAMEHFWVFTYEVAA
jgi:demethylmenaquinone methyltransferase/2-methoxy-6-polyprenyl-1,4-benzoquinol methylase